MFFTATSNPKPVPGGVRILLLLALLPWVAGACLETRADERTLSARQRSAAQRLILSHNCGSCHSLEDGSFRLAGTIGPRLSGQNRPPRSEAWLRQQLTNPLSIPDSEVVPGFEGKQHLMPPLKVSDEDLGLLIRYLRSVR